MEVRKEEVFFVDLGDDRVEACLMEFKGKRVIQVNCDNICVDITLEQAIALRAVLREAIGAHRVSGTMNYGGYPFEMSGKMP